MIRRSRTCCEALTDFFYCFLTVVTCWFCCWKVGRATQQTQQQPSVGQQSGRRLSNDSGIPRRNVTQTQINVGSVHVYPGSGTHQQRGSGGNTPGNGATSNADSSNGYQAVSPAALQERAQNEWVEVQMGTDGSGGESDNHNASSSPVILMAGAHDSEAEASIVGRGSVVSIAGHLPGNVAADIDAGDQSGSLPTIEIAGMSGEGGASIENVTQLEKITVTDEHIQTVRALGFTSDILSDTNKVALQLRVDQGYDYLAQIVDGTLDSTLNTLIDYTWQKEKQRVESGQDAAQEDEASSLLQAIKTAIRIPVAEGSVTDDVEKVAKEKALQSATKEIITQICNYLYFVAVSSGQAFTDGSYMLIDNVGGEHVSKLADFLKRENNGYYGRPSSHIKEETNAWDHFGYDLDVDSFFPGDHRHVLFVDYDDEVTHRHKLFFKPEHYGMKGWSDTFWHLYEWVESSLKRVGLVAVHEVGKVDKKERVKYLSDEERDLMKRFVSLLEQPLEETIVVNFEEDEESLEYQMLYQPVVCDKSDVDNLNSRIQTYGYREIFRLMEMFMTNSDDDGRGSIIHEHFDPLLKEIKDKHPDYRHRSANEVLIAI